MASTSTSSLSRSRRAAFVALELILIAAIPLLGYAGFKTLLETKTGTFVADPVEGEPSWRAFLDPSPVAVVIEVEIDRITGMTVITQPGGDATGGAIILVPGTLVVDGAPLTARNPQDAAQALALAMKLQFGRVVVMDNAGWQSLLGNMTYTIDVPDPIPSDSGGVLLGVGPNPISGETVPAYLGRLVVGNDPLSLIFRRRLFWESMLNDPPTSSHELAAITQSVGSGLNQVYDLPINQVNGDLVPEPIGIEDLINTTVPFPAGAGPGDRPGVRLIDRTGDANLLELAGALGREGVEVLEIGNAREYDFGLTELVVPLGANPEVVTKLAQLVGADMVQAADVDFEGSFTLLVGTDVEVPRN